MQIEYRDGLLFTSIEIVYRGKTKRIDNMVIDTGAAKTLISQHAVEDIELWVERRDRIVTYYGVGGKEHAFTKKLDTVKLGSFQLRKYEVDFSGMDYAGINGLLGLDVLIEDGFVLDLHKLKMYNWSRCPSHPENC
ncbi:retropepsin-like aspartic protease [Anoxybacteroides amylolyticum]|uniref:Aspartyl protease family protein n=1 Tax=Anoxybacteroides amylolyticum TaxID=294699 RepID=A0A160F366_9BACL|nr:retropepsin-like aspartic protease [Anoxybacillus amylolyticus]ANB60381.1 aspartyl protease family protein [Anoxybacillus amylolyticus]